MKINEYDPTQSSLWKAWKAELSLTWKNLIGHILFKLRIFSRPSVMLIIFIKKHLSDKTPLLRLTDIERVQETLSELLSHRSFAMGPATSRNDKKVIVIERYLEFLKKKIPENDIQGGPSTSSSDKSENDLRTTEGLMKENIYFRRQRNRSLRDQCAKRDKFTCRVCGLNFMKVYGDRGDGFIEIHHLKPLSSYEGEHEIKLDELIALCSNCHSMVSLWR